MQNIYPYEQFKVNVEDLIKEYLLLKDRFKDGNKHTNVLVQKCLFLMKQNTYLEFIKEVPYTHSILETLKNRFEFNTVVYRLIMPNTVYDWHSDTGHFCFHIPIITNQGCRFIYEKENFYLEADGTIYIVNQKKHHTFCNAGKEPRVHLIMEKN